MVLTGVSCPWPEDRTLTKPPPKPANATNSMNLCNECYDSIHGRTTNADICCIWPRKDLPSIYCYLQILNYSTIFIIAIIQYNITIRTIHTQSPQGLFSCWHCSILEPFGKSTIWVQNTATLHTVHAFVHVNLLCPLCLQFEQTISWCFGSLTFCLWGFLADSVLHELHQSLLILVWSWAEIVLGHYVYQLFKTLLVQASRRSDRKCDQAVWGEIESG